MLSKIASYLGQATVAADDLPTAAGEVRLRAVVEDDDEWILVERKEEEQEESEGEKRSDEENGGGVTRVTLAVNATPLLDIIPNNTMQESWYLTPPPSFTSQGPVYMETSPLENLLIEHPSMSVYQHSRRTPTTSGAGASPPISTPSSDDDESSSTTRPDLRIRPRTKKDKLGKMARSKLIAGRKKMNKRPQTSSSEECATTAHDEDESMAVEPKLKVQKSPRRFAVHGARRAASSSEELISLPSTSEEETMMVEAVKQPSPLPARRLYSEVLGTKPKPVPVAIMQEPAAAPTEATATARSVVEGVECASERETQLASVDGGVVGGSSNDVVNDEEQGETNGCGEQGGDRRRVVQTVSQQQQRQHVLNRSAQKVEQRKTCDQMKKNSLCRNNKVREVNSRNKRQRRADMMQRHSGANNNRKTC